MNIWQEILKLFHPDPPGLERPSPKIRIRPEQVRIENGTLTVTGLGRCFIAAIAPTNSMEPGIDDGMYVVLDPDVPPEDIIPGDIIWFETPAFKAIHRVMEVGEDASGWYCQCQGDNNSSIPDPVLARKEDIRGVWRSTLN